MKRALLSAVFLLGVTAPSAGRAGEPGVKSECARAHAEGQRLRREGRLSAAHDRFAMCARDQCPAQITSECAGFLADVERARPTVVVLARDRRGADTTEVSVLVDGAPWLDRLSSLAAPIDPGEHVFRFVDREGGEITSNVLVREGEKRRSIAVDFTTLAPRPGGGPVPQGAVPDRVTPSSRPAPVLALVLGGLGLAAAGATAGFGIAALVKGRELEAECAPRCDARLDEVDAVARNALLADISLGASAVLLGTAAVLWITRSPARAKEPAPAAFVVPTLGGAAFGVRVSF